MIRNILLASVVALGTAAGAAQAADLYPQVVNRNGQTEVVYGPNTLHPAGDPSNVGDVVGGANAVVTGSGENLQYRAIPGGHAQANGRVATVTGSGESLRYVYAPAASGQLAGQGNDIGG